MKRSILALAIIAACCTVARSADYNLHLVTDSEPDYTDLPSYVRSATGNWDTPQEKCIAVWRWARRSRKQLSCATEGGRMLFDPILHYNSFGSLNCGIVSSLNIDCYLQLGYRGRYVQLGDHTVSEVSWDDGKTWHMFDSSMSFFCFNEAGQVASCEEIKQAFACERSGGKSEKGHLYFYHPAPQCASHLGPTGWRIASDNPVDFDRTLANGAMSYGKDMHEDLNCQYARYGQRYTLNLRPYESYTRYWKPLDSEVAQSGIATFISTAYGPDRDHGTNTVRGNGRWIFKPDLSTRDIRKVFYDDADIALRAEDNAGPNLHPAKAAAPASVTFKIDAANVITGMQIKAAGTRGSDGDLLRISTSRDAGIHWNPVWEAKTNGPQAIDFTLRDPVAGVTQCLVKIEMSNARDAARTGIDSLDITTLTQVNRLSLPRLSVGANQVALTADEQVESAEIWPALQDGAYAQTVSEEDHVFSAKEADGMYKATLGAGVNGRECSATWKLTVPTDITSVTYGVVSTTREPASYVSSSNSWDGKQFHEFHRKADTRFPMDEQTITTLKGQDVPPGTRQANFRAAFFSTSGAGTYNMAGIQDLLMRVNHKPRDPAFQPIEVTYRWTEHRKTGDVSRSHTELVRSLPHHYTIDVAGFRDPTMDSVSIKLQDPSAATGADAYGYSDHTDVGPGDGYTRVAYQWGNAISEGKPYTTSRPSSLKSGNPDTDGKELTNGIIIASTTQMTGKPIQSATAFWGAGEPVTFVIDLGQARVMGGARISSHQPNAKFCHPKSVEVSVSQDGKEWQAVGRVDHDDLWKPPGDYEAWEHDDDPRYANLPAGGRLAYSFPLAFAKPVTGRYVRFICTPLDGRGMGLSELQVFDEVAVRPWRADIRMPDVGGK